MKFLNKDSIEIGSFISGCLSDDNITKKEKVILMRLGVSYGDKLYGFTDGDNNPDISGCKTINQVCIRLGLPLLKDINVIDLIKERFFKLKHLDKSDINFIISREVLINLVRYSYLSLNYREREKIAGIVSLEFLNHKKWTFSVIRSLISRVSK